MKGVRILLFGMIISGLLLVSCDGSGGGPTDTSNYHPSVLFAETWESYPVGSFPGGGWQDSAVSYFQKEVDIPSNHKFLLHGPSGETSTQTGGIYYLFKPGTMKPTYISYKVHPYPSFDEIEVERAFIGKFIVKGFLLNSDHRVSAVDIHFYHDDPDLGYLRINGDAHPGISNKISIDQSFHIELRNILWDSPPNPTFDLWINGHEVKTCIPFMRDVDSIGMISLSNKDYGRVHFDDIYMADLPVEYHCPVVSEDPPSLPLLPPPPSPTYTREPIIFIINTPAFCRGGPGTNYPKLTTYTENTQLIISGQNLEGTWWWSEGSGCWISDVVGELQGDFTTLDIIIPPPPPDEDPSDGSPGKPSGCQGGMGKDACIANGGTWDDQPGQPGTCICP